VSIGNPEESYDHGARPHDAGFDEKRGEHRPRRSTNR
jgi:hypothetical protein